jgi:hypothetical protein
VIKVYIDAKESINYGNRSFFQLVLAGGAYIQQIVNPMFSPAQSPAVLAQPSDLGDIT